MKRTIADYFKPQEGAKNKLPKIIELSNTNITSSTSNSSDLSIASTSKCSQDLQVPNILILVFYYIIIPLRHHILIISL